MPDPKLPTNNNKATYSPTYDPYGIYGPKYGGSGTPSYNPTKPIVDQRAIAQQQEAQRLAQMQAQQAAAQQAARLQAERARAEYLAQVEAAQRAAFEQQQAQAEEQKRRDQPLANKISQWFTGTLDEMTDNLQENISPQGFYNRGYNWLTNPQDIPTTGIYGNMFAPNADIRNQFMNTGNYDPNNPFGYSQDYLNVTNPNPPRTLYNPFGYPMDVIYPRRTQVNVEGDWFAPEPPPTGGGGEGEGEEEYEFGYPRYSYPSYSYPEEASRWYMNMLQWRVD